MMDLESAGSPPLQAMIESSHKNTVSPVRRFFMASTMAFSTARSQLEFSGLRSQVAGVNSLSTHSASCGLDISHPYEYR
jgi:hypothetical protein